MRKKISLILSLILFIITYQVDAASLKNSEVDIYAINSKYSEKAPIPDDLLQSYKIEVEGATGNITYTKKDSYDGINISSDGVVTPKLYTWHCNSNYCTTGDIDNETYSYQSYNFADDIIVYVKVDGQTLEQTINLKNYAVTYSQEYMNNYLEENITSSMTEYEKMEVIAKFVASYPYSATSTSYVGFILGDGGDCIASSNTIVYMATRVGITAHIRYAVNDVGAGNNHHNVAAILDGKLYIVEAGYSNTTLPRPYDIDSTYDGFSYNYINGIYQYDGYDEEVTIPTITVSNAKNTLKSTTFTYGYHSKTVLKTVNVPSSVTSIEGGTFNGIPTLSTINITNDNYKSVDNVVYTTDGATLVSYPAGKTNTSYTISKGTTTIDSYSLSRTSNLKNIVIPNTVTSIGYAAFYKSSLTSVTLPESVSSISNYAFYSSSNLSYVTILNKNATFDGDYIFSSYTTIIGYSGSTAEEYASEHNRDFIAIDSSQTKAISEDMISDILDSITYEDYTDNKVPITIKNGSYTLKENTDYKLEYSNNTSPGTATVEITGMGSYYGYYSYSYSILKKKITYNIASTTITYGDTLDITTNVDGASIMYCKISDGSANVCYSSTSSYTPGTYNVRIRMIATNYETVYKDIVLTVNKRDINDLTISHGSLSDYKYTGSAITPYIRVYRSNGYTITKDTDYTVTYSNNVNIGTATILVQGIGNYTGSVTYHFNITAIPLSSTSISLSSTYYKYTGSEIKPIVTVKYSGSTLTENTNYTVTYSNNIEAGNGSVLIKGIGNYTGEVTKSFVISNDTSSSSSSVDTYSSYFTDEQLSRINTISLNKMYDVNSDNLYMYTLSGSHKVRIYFSEYNNGMYLKLYRYYSTGGYSYWTISSFKYDSTRRQYYCDLGIFTAYDYFIELYNVSSTNLSMGVYVNGTYNTNVLDEVEEIASTKTDSVIPVYRMYNKNTGEHLYTTDAYEVSVIYKEQGWGFEGIAWYSSTSGTPVYRLYNPVQGNHLYTTDTHEVEVLTTEQGWVSDFNGEPVMYSNGDINIYRLYKPSLNGMHHWTTDYNEYSVLPTEDWVQEGLGFKALKTGNPKTTEYYKVEF